MAEPAKKEGKKGEIVPVDTLIDALHEGIVTTITEIPKHMDVYGDAKPKIEEVLKESAKIEEVLRNLPRKKEPEGPRPKVKPNKEEISKIRDIISKFIPYVQQMQRNGESFHADFTNLKTMEEGIRKTEAARMLSDGMMGAFEEMKGINAIVQGILKNEQYGFVSEPEQNAFEEGLVVFLSEFITFTYIVNYALRYRVTKEQDKKTVDATKKAVLDELKAVADVSEKNNSKYRVKRKEILEEVKQAKGLENHIKDEEKAELDKLKFLKEKAEPIIAAIKDEMKKLLESIKSKDKAFVAFGELEQITVKELKELEEIAPKINEEVGKIKEAAEEKARLQQTMPPAGTTAFTEQEEKVRKLDEAIEASKKEIKAQLDKFRDGVSMEKTLGRREVLSLNTVVNSAQEIITIANQLENALKDKLLAFLQSEEGKKAFKGEEIENATTAALGQINTLQEIITEEQNERNMIGTVGRVMKDRAQKEELLRKDIEEIKKNDSILKDNTGLLTNMPRIANALSKEVTQIASTEQALVTALTTSKETADKIKKQVADVQKTVAEVEALLPPKGFFANLFSRFKR